MSFYEEICKAFDWDHQDLNRAVFAREVEFLDQIVAHIIDYVVSTQHPSRQLWERVAAMLNDVSVQWFIDIGAEDVIRQSGGTLDDDDIIVYRPQFRGSTMDIPGQMRIEDHEDLTMTAEAASSVAIALSRGSQSMPRSWRNRLEELEQSVYAASAEV